MISNTFYGYLCQDNLEIKLNTSLTFGDDKNTIFFRFRGPVGAEACTTSRIDSLSGHWFPPHTPSLARCIYSIENAVYSYSLVSCIRATSFFLLGILKYAKLSLISDDASYESLIKTGPFP